MGTVWQELRVEIARTSADAGSEALGEWGAHWSVFEDAIAQRAWAVGLFGSEVEARAEWAQVRSRLEFLGEPQLRAIADEDWRESYKAHFKAWRCGRLHWVPEWERASHRLPRGHAAVYLDPGLAFGTGNHETTRLCCERLVAFARGLTPRRRRTWRVIDAGCGSGILAISAAKLGCRRIFAFDNDPEAVAIARENARRNRVAGVVRTATGGVADLLQRRRADLVLANLQADVLVRSCRALLGAVAPGGQLVLSGILASELAAVREGFIAAAGPGWAVRSRKSGEWSDLQMQRLPGSGVPRNRRPGRTG